MRRFILNRIKDVSGISGTGVVANGVLFDSGTVVVVWLGTYESVVVWPNMDGVEHVHGHNGSTEIIWID
jgi:hypothetical protein